MSSCQPSWTSTSTNATSSPGPMSRSAFSPERATDVSPSVLQADVPDLALAAVVAVERALGVRRADHARDVRGVVEFQRVDGCRVRFVGDVLVDDRRRRRGRRRGVRGCRHAPGRSRRRLRRLMSPASSSVARSAWSSHSVTRTRPVSSPTTRFDTDLAAVVAVERPHALGGENLARGSRPRCPARGRRRRASSGPTSISVVVDLHLVDAHLDAVVAVLRPALDAEHLPDVEFVGGGRGLLVPQRMRMLPVSSAASTFTTRPSGFSSSSRSKVRTSPTLVTFARNFTSSISTSMSACR